MLTKLRIRNFKQFEAVEIDLSQSVVFIGPNNCGKTSALQALGLWDTGRRAWLTKRAGSTKPEKRPGVTINRREVSSNPVATSQYLWRNLHVREGTQLGEKRGTKNIRIDVEVSGVVGGAEWTCGFEFDFQNEESFICRPLRFPGMDDKKVGDCEFSEVPQEIESVRISYLPPMGGLASLEPRHDPGRIEVLIGEGQTSEILRNLCLRAKEQDEKQWESIVEQMHSLFGVRLHEPEYIVARGEITLAYTERSGPKLDITCAGRGMQQTLLLLSRLCTMPGSVLLLDEPDAHLEILRQRQIFNAITDIAASSDGQIIAASHSETVLNEAANKGTVVAFLGRPHVLAEGKKSQLLKSLKDIGWEQYYQAQQRRWVLYVEDSTDLRVLQEFARIASHPVQQALAAPFVKYVGTDQPQIARDHFHGLKEGVPALAGVALFDRLDREIKTEGPLCELMWRRREIENYFVTREVLLRFAESNDAGVGGLFAPAAVKAMEESIDEVASSYVTLHDSSPWDQNCKISDDFLDPLLRNFSQRQDIPLLMRKSEFYRLVRFVNPSEIPKDVIEKLDAIAEVAKAADAVLASENVDIGR